MSYIHRLDYVRNITQMDFRAKRGFKRSSAKGMMCNTLTVSLLLLIPAVQLVVVGAADGGLDPTKSQPCSLSDPFMDPTYENLYGVDVVWQIPPNPKAVLFLAHPCNHHPIEYFDPGPKCEQCYGMPESRTIVLDALRRGYAVIVVKSIGVCFDVLDLSTYIETSPDLPVVTNVLKEWTVEHSLDGLPFVAWGHSAGTFIVSALTTTLSMQALVLMCGSGLVEVVELATPMRHPPTFFVSMPLDFDVAEVNVTVLQHEAMASLTERGVRVADTSCWPKALSPLFFTERILCMSESTSREIFSAYEAAGWLDSDGYLVMNPSTEDWKSVLLRANALPFCEANGDLCLATHVEQELIAAFAVHGLTSDADDVIFPWLDSTLMSSSLDRSVQYDRSVAARLDIIPK